MIAINQEMLQIKDVVLGPLPDSYLCLTSDAVAEACRRSGTFLWARQSSRIGTAQGIINDKGETISCLNSATPNGDDTISPSPFWVNEKTLGNLNERILNDADPVRRVTTWPIDRTFVYVDVSDFSNENAVRQAFIINSIVHAVDHELYWDSQLGSYCKEGLESRICIGDGYIFVFQKPWHGVMFAAYFAHLIEHLVAIKELPVEFHFRSGVHVGDVFCFWDPGRDNWNYIGDGINGGNRVLGAIGKETDDVVFISGQTRQRLTAVGHSDDTIKTLLASLQNRGRRVDKHGNPWRVYEINHTDLVAGYFEHYRATDTGRLSGMTPALSRVR